MKVSDPPEDAQYTLCEYIRTLEISGQKRLLVEGPTDRELFRRLFQQAYPDYRRVVVIDTADRLNAATDCGERFEGGNRARVVRVCELASAEPEAAKLVGFVDREFDDFDFEPCLRDQRPGDCVSGRLVRARGHSLENYLFDFRAFSDRMREYVPADVMEETLCLFEQFFPDAVRVACTLGLTGYHHPVKRKLERIKSSVGWQLLAIEDHSLALLVDNWGRELIRQHETAEWAAASVREYRRWWSVVQPADYTVVRWLCHGHIGFEVIWAAFARCVYHAAGKLDEGERQRLVEDVRTDRKGKSDVRFRAVVDQWVRQSLQGGLDCPRVILEMIGLPGTEPVKPVRSDG